MLTVALTGGIASGKTAVSNAFSDLGVPVVDADVLSRQAVEPESPGLKAITKRFGQSVIDSDESLNRKALRQIVFNDAQSRKDLEAIVHPEVRRLTEEALHKHRLDNAPYCIVVIPLLVETNQHDKYDHVVVVDVSEETQLERVTSRDGSTTQQAQKILASQATREQRLAVADSVISNTGTLEELHVQVKALHRQLRDIAAARASTDN